MQLPRHIHRGHFLVRIDRQAQLLRREHLTETLLTHPSQVFMTRNMQSGEIVRIGARAAGVLPQAWIGDDLLFSHTVEGSLDHRGVDAKCLLVDEQYNYYLVPLTLCYGVAKKDTGNIFLLEDWILCDPYEAPLAEGVEVDDTGRELVHSEGGLLLFSNYKRTGADLQQDIERLKKEIEWLTKSGVETKEEFTREKNERREQVQREVTIKMKEMESLTRALTRTRTQPFSICYSNTLLDRDLRYQGIHSLDRTWIIWYLSMGAEVATLEYGGKEYYRLKVSQIAYLEKL